MIISANRPTRPGVMLATLLIVAAGSSLLAWADTVDEARLPTISVSRAAQAQLRDLLLVTGTFLAREEVLISPEIEGLAIVELLVEEGDRVEPNQVLARLNRQMLLVQLAQNEAQISRAAASIDNARAQIAEAAANRAQTDAALERSKALRASGAVTTEVYDQRLAAARIAQARADAAQQALVLAEADKVLAERQRAEIELRIARCEIRAPVGGIVSRRSARLGQIATAVAGTEPLFRLIANSEIDFEADVPEISFARLKAGQSAGLEVAGRNGEITGRVRLVAAEMNRTTRLGRVRITVDPANPVALGSFGRGRVLIEERQGLVLPLSAVSFVSGKTNVQVVKGGIVSTRPVETGLRQGSLIEIRNGLAENEEVVSIAGTFVRDGDRVRTVPYAVSQ